MSIRDPEQTSHLPGIWRVLLTYLLVGVAALLPRVLDLGAFVTMDEINYWLVRSERFLEALQRGDYGATVLAPHPAVTTMWLGSVGILLRRGLVAWGLIDYAPFPLLLALMRLPVALVNTGGVVVGYGLLRRLLPGHIALLAALFWATDPFVIGFSRVLHVDSLVATALTLSLLAACCYWNHDWARRSGIWLLVLSAVCGGLAFLSKVTGLAVLPMIGALALLALRFPLASDAAPAGPAALYHHRLRPVLPVQLWAAIFLFTIVVAWPAVWANPGGVVAALRNTLAHEGGQPHAWGNFFLGQPDAAPGPLFYPVALALRLTPLTLVGLLLLPWGWHQARTLPATRRSLLMLVLLVLVVVAVLSLSPKKFNRYLVPIFPALDVLAAVGLVWGAERGAALLRSWRQVGRAVVGVAGALALLNAAWWHPYGLAAFNQLFGGARAGAATFAVGWGEGLAQAAAWLNQQPDITGVTIASDMVNSFQPYLRHGAQAMTPPPGELPADVGYVLVYVREVQRELLGAPFSAYYPRATPLYTVTIHGVPYAWVYQVPPPVARPLTATFALEQGRPASAPASAPAIHLRGVTIDTTPLQTTGALSLTAQWQGSAPLPADYRMFAHILRPDGTRLGQADVPPGGPAQPASTWLPQRVVTWVHPVPVPADLSPGRYWLALGLYEPGGRRLPLVAGAGPPGAPDAGGDAVRVPFGVGGWRLDYVTGGAMGSR